MKDCLIIGPKSVTWYKDGYPLLKAKELFIGHHGRLEDEGIWLEDKNGVPAKVLCLWYTTLTVKDYDKPYVLTARAKGLTPSVIMTRHVLRNALIPIVTYVSLSIPYLFTGSLLLESFFGIPGLGSVSINAIQSADLAVVRAVVVLGALLYQFVNLATDLLYAILDPRVAL